MLNLLEYVFCDKIAHLQQYSIARVDLPFLTPVKRKRI